MTSFALTLGDRPYSPRPPFIITVFGFTVLEVDPGWRGPLRIYLRREGWRPLLIWVGPAQRHRHHQFTMVLSPHFGEGVYVLGGRIVISGAAGWCSCCLGEVPQLPAASWGPDGAADSEDEEPPVAPAAEDEESWD